MNADRVLIAIAAAGLLALPLHFLGLGGARRDVDPGVAGSKAERVEKNIQNLGVQIRQKSASEAMLLSAEADRDRAAREVGAVRTFLNLWSKDLWVPPQNAKLMPAEIVLGWQSDFERRREALLKTFADKGIDASAVRNEISSPYDIPGLTPELIRRKQFDKRIRISESLCRLLMDNHARRIDLFGFRRFDPAVAGADEPYSMPRGEARVFEVEIEFQMPWMQFPIFVQRLLNHPTIPFTIRHVQIERLASSAEAPGVRVPGGTGAAPEGTPAPSVRIRVHLWVLDFQPSSAPKDH